MQTLELQTWNINMIFNMLNQGTEQLANLGQILLEVNAFFKNYYSPKFHGLPNFPLKSYWSKILKTRIYRNFKGLSVLKNYFYLIFLNFTWNIIWFGLVNCFRFNFRLNFRLGRRHYRTHETFIDGFKWRNNITWHFNNLLDVHL